MSKKRKTKLQIRIERVKALLKEVQHVLPIDLSKVPNGIHTTDEVFELENGMNVIFLNETDCETQHPKHSESAFEDYENLPVADLNEIVRILEDVSTDCYKTMQRCQN